MSPSPDPFFEVYDREQVAYGLTPSAAVNAYLQQIPGDGGRALDLGAGAGRDTLALAKAGYEVTAVDLSPRGLDRISQRAEAFEVDDRVKTEIADVRAFEIPTNRFDAIVATTVLDHIPAEDATAVWKKMAAGLTSRGVLFVEVHTTEDPGCDQMPGAGKRSPVSETASAVINYFRPNQLVSWAVDSEAHLRVLRYEERLEWDYTHGPEHQHGKAVLLAVRAGSHPDWYGQPQAFPRQ